MTFRAGDPFQIELRFASLFGNAPVYSSLAEALAAGWTFIWRQGGAVMSTQPTMASLTPDPSNDGTHYLVGTLSQGICTLKAVPPTTRRDLYSVFDVTTIAPINDTDSLAASISSATGTVVTGGIVTAVADQNFTEGDSYQAQFTIPTSALKVFDNTNKLIYQYTDLSDIGGQPWTIAAQARYLTENGQVPSNPVAFSFQAQVLDKTNRVVGIGWLTAPTAAVVDDVLPSAPTIGVSGNQVTSVTGGTGGHIYNGRTVTVTLTGGGGTGAVVTAVVGSNGQITGYTITSPGSGYSGAPTAALSVDSDGAILSRTFRLDIQLVPPVGSTYATAKLTVVVGNFIINRQQTTTP